MIADEQLINNEIKNFKSYNPTFNRKTRCTALLLHE
jgi:hypothetical protein